MCFTTLHAYLVNTYTVHRHDMLARPVASSAVRGHHTVLSVACSGQRSAMLFM
jgi:hypothetical protein